jgi:rhodanese-related sulfurtransferase
MRKMPGKRLITFITYFAYLAITTLAVIPVNAAVTAQLIPTREMVNFNDITYGKGIFVAVGEAGKIALSTDGLLWTKPKSGVTETLHAVEWCEDCFMTVGDHGTIVLSKDGTKWRTIRSGIHVPLRGIVRAGKQYIAVGDHGTIITSPKGNKWISVVSGTDAALYGVTTNQTTMVAVGEHSTILTSGDGLHWKVVKNNPETNTPDYVLKKVKWNGVDFITVGYWNGGTIYPASLGSPTGEVWNERIIQQTANHRDTRDVRLNSVACDGTKYVAVGSPGILLTIPSCPRCSILISAAPDELMGVTTNGSQLIAVGKRGIAAISKGEFSDLTVAAINPITPAAVKEKMSWGACLIDVRTQDEYLREHIPGSILVPLEQLSEVIKSVVHDQQREIIVYCRSGERSALAAERLIKLGYAKVYDLGGIDSWPYEKVSGEGGD